MNNNITVCPNCASKNRVSGAHSGVPVCGKCQTALPWLVNLDSASNFESWLQSDVPVLLDLWAEWCPPCKRLAPVLEELATTHAGRLKIIKIDVEAFPQLQERFFASSIPTLVVMQQGKEVDRGLGFMPLPKLAQLLAPFVKPLQP